MSTEKIETIFNHIVQRPADYIIYKGKAALQFSLKKASPTSSGKYVGSKKGVVFLAAAPQLSKNRYDWENSKVTIGLSEHELGQFIYALRGKEQVKFYHDKFKGTDREGEEIKQMLVSSSDGTVFVNISETINGTKREIPGVPISKPEAIVLTELLKTAISKTLGWK